MDGHARSADLLKVAALAFWLVCALLMALDWSTASTVEQPFNGVQVPFHQPSSPVRQQ
jgi:hypothetical protein